MAHQLYRLPRIKNDAQPYAPEGRYAGKPASRP